MTFNILARSMAFAAAFAAGSALAQMPRAPVSTGVDPGYQPAPAGVPSFRDPKTGQVWTPDNVGGGPAPVTAADRAFNPAGQTDRARSNQQVAGLRVIGSVPITAGPTVPLINLDSPSLMPLPGAAWRVVLYLQNNSGSTIAPSLNCRFTNAGRLVLDSYVSVPPVGGGVRVGLTLSGPPSDVFVDNVSCNVVQP
jgi:hypothetical protein